MNTMKEIESLIEQLIEEGSKVTFANNSYRESHGVYGSLSTSFRAWNAKVENLVLEHYGNDSAPMRLLEKLNLSKIKGNYDTEFNEQHAIIMGTLEACRTIKPKLVFNSQTNTALSDLAMQKVFIVHGHDIAIQQTVARTIETLLLKPIILSDEANEGKTIIEKFEKHSDVGFAIVLLTSDDVGRARANEDDRGRARQNVVLELGYFMGKLGRARVLPLYVAGVELPSDLHGIVYTLLDEQGHWKYRLVKELRVAGYAVDANLLI